MSPVRETSGPAIEQLSTPVHAVRLTGDVAGRSVAVLGAGTIGLFTLAGLATTAAPNAWTLVVARILQSIGACAGLAYLRDPDGGVPQRRDQRWEP